MKKCPNFYIILLVALYTICNPIILKSSDYKWFHSINLNRNAQIILPLENGDLWYGTARGMGKYGSSVFNGGVQDLYPELFSYGVYSLQALEDDRILIWTNDSKFYIYTPVSNELQPLKDKFSEWGINLEENWSLKVHVDRNDDIWCYSGNKLYVRRNNKTILFPEFEQRINGFDINGNEICVLTDSIIYISDSKSGKVLIKERHDVPHDVFIQSVKIDIKGNVWIGNDNLYRYDRSLGTWQTIRKNIHVNDILISRNGNILIATNSSGILVYDVCGKLNQHIRHVPYCTNSLLSDRVMALRESADSILWICYEKQFVSICNPNEENYPVGHIYAIKQSGRNDDIISIFQDHKGKIYMGTNDSGIYYSDSVLGDSDMTFSKLFGGDSYKTISSIYTDSHDCLWFGSYRDGVYCVKDGITTNYLKKSSPYSIIEDGNGDIWVGLLGDGVYKLPRRPLSVPCYVDLENGKWVHDLTGNKSNIIYAATSNGLFAISVNDMKPVRINGTSKDSVSFNNHHFKACLEDSRDLLWLLGNKTECPLEIYDLRNDTIIHLPQFKGLDLRSVVEDDYKNIWISSDRSIIHILVNYNPLLKKYDFYPYTYNYKTYDNVSAYYNYRSAAKLNDGRIVFGRSEGYHIIDPKQFPPFTDAIKPYRLSISGLMINNELIKVGEMYNGRKLLPKDLSQISGIELKSGENNITISVVSHDYTSPFVTNNYYRLRNIDESWLPILNNQISLSNLSAGIYNLEISYSNPDGSMSDDVISFDIKVDSPWYLTPIAIVGYILIGIVVLAIIVMYYIGHQKQKIYIRQAQKEVERQVQLNEMKLRFFTNVSHDFRTPLTLIITPLEAYLNDPKNKKDEKFLYPVYRNAQRLLTLVNQILDFRKIDVNSTSINLSYGDIVSFVREICQSFSLFAEDTGKRLTIDSDNETINLYFDRDKMSKIIMNLLSNAFKFTNHDGNINVRISEKDEMLEISIADDGIGIPDNEKSLIFQRFYQRDKESDSNTGSGIGLHIVKEFVELHQGNIIVKDNEPSGTNFVVRIPLVKSLPDAVAHTDDADSHEYDISNPTESYNDGNLRTLLLVEDNDEFLEFMRNQLSNEYNVLTASNGIEAKKILNSSEVNIIISDVMMDGMNGLDLCKEIKTDLNTSHIPFILLTAKAMVEDEIQGFECGADEYITKPFNLELLRHRIKKLFDENLRSHKKFKEKLDIKPSEITITSLDEQFLANAIKSVENNIDNPDFSVEMLSSSLGIHRTYLYKKISSLTGESPIEFIRLIRLKRAAQYLVKSQLYISEIAYKVGYNSPRLFSQHFKEKFGMLPREYQKQNIDKI